MPRRKCYPGKAFTRKVIPLERQFKTKEQRMKAVKQFENVINEVRGRKFSRRIVAIYKKRIAQLDSLVRTENALFKKKRQQTQPVIKEDIYKDMPKLEKAESPVSHWEQKLMKHAQIKKEECVYV